VAELVVLPRLRCAVVDSAPILMPGVSGRVDVGAQDRGRIVAELADFLSDAKDLLVIAEAGGLTLRHVDAHVALAHRSLIFDEWVTQPFDALFSALGVFSKPPVLEAPVRLPASAGVSPDEFLAEGDRHWNRSVGHGVVRYLCGLAAQQHQAARQRTDGRANLWGISVTCVSVSGRLSPQDHANLSKSMAGSDRVIIASSRREVLGALPDSLAGDRLDVQREIDHIVENLGVAISGER